MVGRLDLQRSSHSARHLGQQALSSAMWDGPLTPQLPPPAPACHPMQGCPTYNMPLPCQNTALQKGRSASTRGSRLACSELQASGRIVTALLWLRWLFDMVKHGMSIIPSKKGWRGICRPRGIHMKCTNGSVQLQGHSCLGQSSEAASADATGNAEVARSACLTTAFGEMCILSLRAELLTLSSDILADPLAECGLCGSWKGFRNRCRCVDQQQTAGKPRRVSDKI